MFGYNQDRFFLRDIHKKSRCHDPYTDDPLGMGCLRKNQPVWHDSIADGSVQQKQK